MKSIVSRLVLVWILTLSFPAFAAEKLQFGRDIRPILADKCFACHGPAAKQAESDLRLDSAEAALKPGESGRPAIVPGKPESSELVRRILSTDEAERMPPPDAKKQLSDNERGRLRQWIAEGAEYQAHWAFVRPSRPPVPAVKNTGWVRNELDRFVLARLEREGWTPAPVADRTTLLRRLSLDLTGLPPTIAEVDSFLADQAHYALERQVERLLKSPNYGERWGRHWLDAARYADSDGYEKDKPRFVWAYRDWVVRAIQDDLPYDRFIIEQIAGDLLPHATQDQVVATGFLRNSMINEEGGVDPEQFRMEAMFDRMDAIGKGILGLTIQCGQCHTHKYDPLTQEEYYRLFAFLNDTHEANIGVYTGAERQQREEILGRIAAVERGLQSRHPHWRDDMSKWEDSIQAKPTEWIVLQPAVDEISTGGQKYLPLPDGSFLAQGYAPTKHRVKLTVQTKETSIAAFRLELLNDPNLPLTGPGRSIFGTAALTEFEVEAAPIGADSAPVKVAIAKAMSDAELPERPLADIYDDRSKKTRVTGPIAYALDGKEETAWGIDVGPGRRNQPHHAVFVLDPPLANPAGTQLTFYLKQNHGGWNSDDNQTHNLGRFRLSLARQTDTPENNAASIAAWTAAQSFPTAVRDILAIPSEQRQADQVAAVFSYWRTTVPEWRAENEEIESLWKQHPEGTSQFVLQARQMSRPTHLLDRGDFLKPKHVVAPGVPAFLHPLSTGAGVSASGQSGGAASPADPLSPAPPSRLDFARWLADRNSPTTARAFVNRVWQTYFGTGLVATSEDLGLQSDSPSHPELLDWLAVEFMDSGWSLKSLHRLIVSSATYRQSSRVTPEGLERDPANRLLARGTRMRVEAETVRDIALAASGLLNPKVGGPSVHPAAPAFLFSPPASYGPKVWHEDTGPDRYRRALYTFRFRSVPYPLLQTFDAPNGDVACVRRTRSNTPMQALMTLNETIFLECARALALRTLQEGGTTDAERLTFAFRRCLSRPPDDAESKLLLALFEKQRQRFAAGDQNAWELAASDPANPPSLPNGTTAPQLAGWTAVARVLLNLDETITKE